MSLMNFKALQAFCLILRRGSLAAAAEDMNLSQPAVSRLISNLEHEVRFPLFHRNKRALRPTAEARAFHREAERILAGIEQLGDIARDIHHGTGRQLRVVAMSRLATAVLPRAAAAFHTRLPDVGLTLETHHRRDMERWLNGRQFDVGFGPLPIEDSQLDIRRLGRTAAIAVLPEDGALGCRTAVTARDLADLPLIALTPDTLLQRQMDAIFALAGITPRVGLRTSSSQLACSLAASGLGYTITDPMTASAIPEPLAIVPITPAFPLDYGILTPKDEVPAPAAEVFIDCMKGAFESLSLPSHAKG